MNDESQNTLTRRGFVQASCGCVALGVLSACGMANAETAEATQTKEGLTALGAVADFSPGQVRIFPDQGVIVVAEEGGLRCLDWRCTHRQEPLRHDPERNILHCPRHQATFGLDGSVLSPPASSSLVHYALSLQDGQLLANLEQTVDPGLLAWPG